MKTWPFRRFWNFMSSSPISSFSTYNNAFFDRQEEPRIFLKNTLKNIFEIGQRLISFSNDNFKIRELSTSNQWVLRVPHEISNLLSDRRQERKVLEWAWQEGFSLVEVKGYDLDKGYLLTRFLNGQFCSAPDFQNPIKLQKALNILYRLHCSKITPISTRFHPLDRFTATLRIATKSGLSLPAEVHEIASKLRGLLLRIPPSFFQSVPCHNDPSPENFFQQNDFLYLHDWEFAGSNDPMWDLTHLSVIAQIDPENILSIYPTSDPFALEKMTFFRPFIFFNTVVWASLERQQHLSSLSPEITEMLYQNFLEKISVINFSQDFLHTLYHSK